MAKHHAAFFRESGWLVIANVVGGLMTFGLHPLTKNPERLPAAEYAIFVTLVSLTNCLPTLPLQMVFGQQTAACLATGRERQAAGMIRLAWLWTALLWIVAMLVVLPFQHRIAAHWGFSHHSAILWVTLLVLLVSLWMPMFCGVLQGQQNFFWLGWASILGGVARLGAAVLLVLALRGGATGMMIGVLLGIGLSTGIAIWHTRRLWSLPSERFDGRKLIAQVVPLMLGFGAFQFMFSSDTMFSQGYFGKDELEMASYGAAGTLSRGLQWLVMPLAAVMFPKIVHSIARSEKTNLQGLVLLGTAALGICGVAGLCLLGPWVVKIVYPAKFVAAATALLPWYAGAMVPLTLANVMINNLLARSSFRVVPALVVLAIGYGLAITHFHDTPVIVLKTMGISNLVLLAVCSWFTWGVKAKPAEARSMES